MYSKWTNTHIHAYSVAYLPNIPVFCKKHYFPGIPVQLCNSLPYFLLPS